MSVFLSTLMLPVVLNDQVYSINQQHTKKSFSAFSLLPAHGAVGGLTTRLRVEPLHEAAGAQRTVPTAKQSHLSLLMLHAYHALLLRDCLDPQLGKARIFASPSAAQLPLNLDLTDSDTDGLSSLHFAPAAPAGWIDCKSPH